MDLRYGNNATIEPAEDRCRFRLPVGDVPFWHELHACRRWSGAQPWKRTGVHGPGGRTALHVRPCTLCHEPADDQGQARGSARPPRGPGSARSSQSGISGPPRPAHRRWPAAGPLRPIPRGWPCRTFRPFPGGRPGRTLRPLAPRASGPGVRLVRVVPGSLRAVPCPSAVPTRWWSGNRPADASGRAWRSGLRLARLPWRPGHTLATREASTNSLRSGWPSNSGGSSSGLRSG
jgi:hypothetical protein